MREIRCVRSCRVPACADRHPTQTHIPWLLRPAQMLGVDVAACRKHVFQSRQEVSARAASLASRGWSNESLEFLADLLWEDVAFNTNGRKTLIAIASCCDEQDWAHELLATFRIFDPSELRLTKTLAQAVASQDLIQILHENNTQHHKHLKNVSGVGFQEIIFFGFRV